MYRVWIDDIYGDLNPPGIADHRWCLVTLAGEFSDRLREGDVLSFPGLDDFSVVEVYFTKDDYDEWAFIYLVPAQRPARPAATAQHVQRL